MRNRELARWVSKPVDPRRADAAWAKTQRALVWDQRRGWVALAGLLLVGLGLLAAGTMSHRRGDPLDAPRLVNTEQRVTLIDGSWVEVAAASAMTVTRDTPSQAELSLDQGELTVEVTSAGRPWTVHIGALEVRLQGPARLLLHRSAAPAVVVERGFIELMDESGTRRLEAGQVWPPPAHEAPVKTLPPAPEPLPLQQLAPSPKRLEVTPAPRDAERLYSDWLEARSAQHWAELEAISRRFLRTAPRDARAGLVELELGRVQMDRLGQPREAAKSFAHALLNSPDAPWAEDALARRVLALEQAGEAVECREARQRYLERFPAGRRAQDVQSACQP